MVENSPFASHCSALRSWTAVMWRLESVRDMQCKRKKLQKHEKKKECFKVYKSIWLFAIILPRRRWKNYLTICTFTVMADCIRIGGKAARLVTEAQFRSTFSNRVFSKNKPVTIKCNDVKRKTNLSWFQRCYCNIFPMMLKGLNRGLK